MKALLIALADEEMIKVMDSIMDRSRSFNDIVAENTLMIL